MHTQRLLMFGMAAALAVTAAPAAAQSAVTLDRISFEPANMPITAMGPTTDWSVDRNDQDQDRDRDRERERRRRRRRADGSPRRAEKRARDGGE